MPSVAPLLLVCGPDDSSIIYGFYWVTRWGASAGVSLRWCVSDDPNELRKALLAPVRWIIWDTHGGWDGPTFGGHRLDELLGGGTRRITAKVFMLGCCWGGTPKFTNEIRRYLAQPTAFLGCQEQPGSSHGRKLFPPVLEALSPLVGTRAAPKALVAVMNTALAAAVAKTPALGDACWQAKVLRPLPRAS